MKEKQKLQNKTAVAETVPAVSEGFSLISNEKLLALYSHLLRCRRLAERARELGGWFNDALGWEAAAAGVAIDLTAEDTLATAQGNLAPALVKGAPLSFFAELMAGAAPIETGFAQGYGPLNVVAGAAESSAALNIATGVALANKVQSNSRVAVAFCGEGQQALELWSEALEFAGAHELPILFVCQNRDGETNGQLSADEIAERAAGAKIPAMPVDGSDVVAVYRVAYESIGRARRGRGPTMIDCRMRAGADAIAQMETYLGRKGIFRDGWKQEVLASFEKELENAFAAAGKSAADKEVAVSELYAVRERTLIRKEWALKF
jgi:TPP-dependent pyruvate/acetoin dehydrogenase alpha subunit